MASSLHRAPGVAITCHESGRTDASLAPNRTDIRIVKGQQNIVKGSSLQFSFHLCSNGGVVGRRQCHVTAMAAEAGALSEPGQVVEFVLVKQCQFGQAFFVVGSAPQLGSWDLTKALAMEWSEGHVWRGSTAISADDLASMEFKYVMLGKRGEVEWQPGGNHVAGDNTKMDGVLTLQREWEVVELVPSTAESTTSMESETTETAVSDVTEDLRQKEGGGEEQDVGSEGEGAVEGSGVVAEVAVVSTDSGLIEDAEVEEQKPGAVAAVPSESVPGAPKGAESSNGSAKRKAAVPGGFAKAVNKDAEWGRNVLKQLLGSWGRKTLMDEESSKNV